MKCLEAKVLLCRFLELLFLMTDSLCSVALLSEFMCAQNILMVVLCDPDWEDILCQTFTKCYWTKDNFSGNFLVRVMPYLGNQEQYTETASLKP